MRFKWLIVIISVFVFFSCKKTSTQGIKINVVFDNLSGKSDVDRAYSIDSARLYLSNFQLIDNDGNPVTIKDLILVRSEKPDYENSFQVEMPKGNYTKLRFSYGLDIATNNSNPAVYSPEHPLSLNQDMYWGMLKYRFLVVEAKIDSSAARNQTPVNSFSMHLGNDTLYRTITKEYASISKGDEITIHLDFQKIFVLDQLAYNINNFSNHSDVSQIPKAILITDAFVNGITTNKVSILPD